MAAKRQDVMDSPQIMENNLQKVESFLSVCILQ